MGACGTVGLWSGSSESEGSENGRSRGMVWSICVFNGGESGGPGNGPRFTGSRSIVEVGQGAQGMVGLGSTGSIALVGVSGLGKQHRVWGP